MACFAALQYLAVCICQGPAYCNDPFLLRVITSFFRYFPTWNLSPWKVLDYRVRKFVMETCHGGKRSRLTLQGEQPIWLEASLQSITPGRGIANKTVNWRFQSCKCQSWCLKAAGKFTWQKQTPLLCGQCFDPMGTVREFLICVSGEASFVFSLTDFLLTKSYLSPINSLWSL